jgi:hypothetical protein
MRRCAILLVVLLVFRATSAAAQVEFKPKAPPPGKETHEVSVTVAQTLTIAGMELKTESDSAYTISSVAGEKDSDGNVPIQQKFESVRSSLALPGGINVNFDSSINLAKADNPLADFLLDAFKALHGATFTSVVTPDNRLVRVEGADKVIDKAGDKAGLILKSQLSEERMKREHAQVHDRYPDKQVKPGDTWEVTEETDFGSGQILKVLRQFEYVGTEERGGRTVDKINAVDKKVISFEAQPSEQQPFKISDSELEIAESKGTILFDRQRGAEVENSRVMHLKGKLTLTLNNNELPTMLDLRIEATNRLKP